MHKESIIWVNSGKSSLTNFRIKMEIGSRNAPISRGSASQQGNHCLCLIHLNAWTSDIKHYWKLDTGNKARTACYFDIRNQINFIQIQREINTNLTNSISEPSVLVADRQMRLCTHFILNLSKEGPESCVYSGVKCCLTSTYFPWTTGVEMKQRNLTVNCTYM